MATRVVRCVALVGASWLCSALCLAACGRGAADEVHSADLRVKGLSNRAAYIPPQCFTRVVDAEPGAAAAPAAENPCYVCHASAREPNMQSQPELQLAYDFPQLRAGSWVGNPWTNLFRERGPQLAAISDEAVREYVAQDNYADGAGQNQLAQRLAELPAEWDADGNGRWDGYVPEAYFDFDARGFDRGPDGEPTGYRTFAYYPLPGGFTPASGSFDDVMIRLPAAFRTNGAGQPDLEVYAINLAILEALIRRQDVPLEPVDERALGTDLDGDGLLGLAGVVRYRFDARDRSHSLQYVGRAGTLYAEGKLQLAPGLFPEGTEFLHSVRYLAVDEAGSVRPALRMKELRYARKQRWLSYAQLRDQAQREQKDAALNPDRPELFSGDGERGLYNPTGWVLQGFIEDAAGRLRPQTYEETVFCMGCHGGLSATEDSTFAFARKVSGGAARGWRPQRWEPGEALPDPLREDGEPEFASYLRHNPEGDGYRSHEEVRQRFFDAAGAERPQAFAQLARDVRSLLLPSASRALALDKAYWLIVREQSFRVGRDPVLAPLRHVLREVEPDAPTGIAAPLAAPRLQYE